MVIGQVLKTLGHLRNPYWHFSQYQKILHRYYSFLELMLVSLQAIHISRSFPGLTRLRVLKEKQKVSI